MKNSFVRNLQAAGLRRTRKTSRRNVAILNRPTAVSAARLDRYVGSGSIVQRRLNSIGRNTGSFKTRAGGWQKGAGGRFVGSK